MYKKLLVGALILLNVVFYGCSNKSSNKISKSYAASSVNITSSKKPPQNNKNSIRTKTLIEALTNNSIISLTGNIAGAPIHMNLIKDPNASFPNYFKDADKYSDTIIAVDHTKYAKSGVKKAASFKGSYYYDKIKQNINIIATLYQGGLFEIIEYDSSQNINGYFKGFVQNNKITGGWISAKASKDYPYKVKEYPFYLTNGNTSSNNNSLQGYYKNQFNEAESSNMVIFNEDSSGFQFAIDGRHSSNVGINIGSISGKATFTDASKKTG
ncbi:hypothetical protein [Clostridium acetobutylicum]|uniref:hypothetical protein n=1 Tax=Clostridium acetobutylicum TaxID=1488 RepID=UPI0017C3E8F0|nr:hypothetical protein [Clostridium acetobutylicum]NYC96095.1 hypothetical protein [Clostridium acetobutylicum]